MKPQLYALPGNEMLAETLTPLLEAERGELTIRHFPDGESYVRIHSDCCNRPVILLCTLHQPDEKLLPLFFLERTLRELGASRVGLIAPYLSYLRQDSRFQEGESITSRHFASLLSSEFDWLLTVDPHLHRYASLSEIYSIPAHSIAAAPIIAEWIQNTVDLPVLVGPDSESEQWVAKVAQQCQTPHFILQKVRHGDREVEVSIPDTEKWQKFTPVLVDDIISTGRTMIETIQHLKRGGLRSPVCIGVHAVFSAGAYHDLRSTGAAEIITCNSISHRSNGIDLAPAIARAVRELGLIAGES